MKRGWCDTESTSQALASDPDDDEDPFEEDDADPFEELD